MEQVVIGTPNGLRISEYDRDLGSITAELALPGLTATAVIYEYTNRPHPLVAYFQELAHNWRGWAGTKDFTSLESDLKLSARHTGHIVITAQLRHDINPEWTAKGDFQLDPGEELAAIATALADVLG